MSAVRDIEVGPIKVPAAEFEFTFARSGGPGGQNVNKVNSKATLRWNVAATTALPEGVRQHFLTRFGNRLTTTGDLLIVAQDHRDRLRNIDECQAKLTAMIAAVLRPPKTRRPTKPTAGSIRRRKEAKVRQSQKKQNRRAGAEE